MSGLDPLAPMIFQRWTDEFEVFEYALRLDQPFEITTPLQALQMEAGAKGMGIIVMCALVPLESIFGSPLEGEGATNEQST